MRYLTILLVLTINTFANASELNVAFIYQHPVSAGGWSLTHDLGRQGVEEYFGNRVETTAIEGITPGPDTVRILTRLGRENYDMVFATSFGHMNGVVRVARSYPETIFEHASGYKLAPNIGTYQIRAYEGRFLAGVLAGSMTESGKLGFVAAFPIPEVVRGINAFLLGARQVRSDASLNVIWINTWMDPGKSREAAELLIDQDVDVLTHHTESAAIIVAAEQRGVFSIGYQHDRSAAGPTKHLASVEHNWTPIYVDIIESKLNNRWQSRQRWVGLSENATRLVGISKDIPEDVHKRIDEITQSIINKDMHVFSGPIFDTEGTERVAFGESIDDVELQRMEWFAKGVLQSQ